MGFVLGSAAAIAFSLIGSVAVFLVLKSKYPALEAELPALLTSAGLFVALAVTAAISFYGQVKGRAWRYAAIVALLVVLITVAGYHGLR
ncbi:MAG TPA: hypothetical protein VIQ99_03220 [Gammaproteobacteria bacterium]